MPIFPPGLDKRAAEGGTGTYVLEGGAVRMSGTSDLDGSPMEVTFTVEGQGAERLLAMEADGVTVLWEQGEAVDRPAGGRTPNKARRAFRGDRR